MDDLSRDEQDLARFGYTQELKRSLGVFSSFAVAFSYISPSTGIFALFFLGLTTVGGVFIWSWPIVAIGQLLHRPRLRRAVQPLSGRGLGLPVDEVSRRQDVLVVRRLDLPVRRHPHRRLGLRDASVRAHSSLQQHGLEPGEQPCEPAMDRGRSRSCAITVMNIFGVRLVAIVNNTGVLFEILGMVVFAFILALFHHHQSAGVIFHTGGTSLTTGTFLVAMFMSLFVIYGFDTASTLSEETKDPRREAPKAVIGSILGAFVIGGIFLFAMLLAIPNMKTAIKDGFGPGADHRRELRQRVLDGVPPRRVGGDLRLLPRRSRRRRSGCASACRATARCPARRCSAKVHPKLHTPVGSCIAIGDPGVHPDAAVRGRRDHRDRSDGDDLSLSTSSRTSRCSGRGSRAGRRRRRRSRSGSGALPLNLLALAWGGGMLDQLRVAACRDEPDAEADAPRRSTSTGTG